MSPAPVRVAVVGAGPAGLCAAKHAQDAGFSCEVFEQSDGVGGTWQYTDCVGTDRYGIPIHTSMYRDLRVNLPKEIVQFPGVPHKEKVESYITSEEILEYLNNYADLFSLRPLLKFNHHVKRIARRHGVWEMTVVDLAAGRERSDFYDAFFICNGINNKPFTAYVNGAENFKGRTLHSHDYRRPEPFSSQQVLIIGAGPSGLDLANHIAKFAAKVFFSHHSERVDEENLRLPANVDMKPDVRELRAHSAQFMDDTVEDIDTIVYCTGYKCNYSFMDESCGITVDDGLVYPLYQYFINANQTSMCIMGNMCYSMQFPTFDIQVRFFVKTLTNSNILPSKAEMLMDIEEQAKKKLTVGKPKKAYFRTTSDEDADYYDRLAAMADLTPLPKVLAKIHARAAWMIHENFPLFRGDNYNIVDDENFVVSRGEV